LGREADVIAMTQAGKGRAVSWFLFARLGASMAESTGVEVADPSRIADLARRIWALSSVALRTEARPLVIWVWPHTISENGIALLSSPMPRKAAQTRAS
jgi:hypothetical protein